MALKLQINENPKETDRYPECSESDKIPVNKAMNQQIASISWHKGRCEVR
jgi:hypothetical protein